MLLLSLFALVVSSLAQNQDNIFLNPPTNGINNDFTQNPTYVQGSTITLQWETTYPATDLVIWQNGNPSSQLLEGGITAMSLSWTVGTGESPAFDLTKGNVFFFQMYNSSTTTFFSSHYFNVSDPSLASATSAALSSSTSAPASPSTHAPTSSESSSKTATVTSVVTTTPTLSADSASGHNNSSDSRLGEGLGIGIGVCVFLILVAGLVWYFLGRRPRSQQPKVIDPPYQVPQSETASAYANAMGYQPPSSEFRRYELGPAAPSTQAELDGRGAKAV